MEPSGFWFLQVVIPKGEDLVSKNWSNFPERIRRSLMRKSSESFPTIKTEEYVEERTHFIFFLSIGPDRMMPKVIEPSLENIKLTLSCAPGG